MTIINNNFNGDLTRYSWESFSYAEPYSGEVYTGDRISGHNIINLHRYFRLEYLSNSDNTASLSYLEGSWSFAKGTSFSFDVSIDQFGTLSGTDSDGCFYSGVVTAPEPQKNIYQLAINKSSCIAKNGDYTGLGYVLDNTFTYAFSNDSYAMYGRLVKI